MEPGTQVDIVKRDENKVTVRLREHHVFVPFPLSIDISLTGQCEVESTVSDEDIITAIRNAGYPLYAKRSQIVGMVSEASLGVPIILPPSATDVLNSEPYDTASKVKSRGKRDRIEKDDRGIEALEGGAYG